ncbi:VOC family protein [Planococcus koreensis]|uniref:VOC family protein n=1 Tax=Planococcus koreensis TaxID=112331 RepID=UPI0039FBE0BD
MSSEITHVGLAVPNLDQAMQWYCSVLGFYILSGPTEFDAAEAEVENITQNLQGSEIKKMRNVHLMSMGGVGIELFEFREADLDEGPPTAHRGFFHICLIVENVVEAIERIVQHGGKQRSQIHQMNKDKNHYLVYTEDLFGNILELSSRSTSEMYSNR